MKSLVDRLTSVLKRKPAGLQNALHDHGVAERPVPADFEPQNELERALIEAATHPEQRSRFERMVLDDDLFAATPEPRAGYGWRTLKGGETLKLLNVADPAGRPVAAIFTSEARVAQVFGAGAGFVQIPGETLLEMVIGTGAMLNPGLAYGVHWEPAALSRLLGKPVARTIKKDTQILLGTPVARPEELIAALREAFAAVPSIEAWLALAHWPEDHATSWYLDVRTEKTPAELNELLSEVFRHAPFDGHPLDMVVNKHGGSPGTGICVAPLSLH